ncbi:MAG: hypothetical protein KAS78_02265, partial [Candidatus Pacebacteria bacterium]|nr:hypothetical protein [Candidatus Paceibacterota bacterium]
IKNYLSEEKTDGSRQTDDLGFGRSNKKNILKNKKAILAIVLLIIIAVSSLFYFTRMKGKRSFDETKVKVSVDVPGDIASGEEIVFDIKYENNTSVSLRNARISLFIPAEFLFISSDKETKTEEKVLTWNLENIPAGEAGNIKLFGKVTGELDKEYNFNSKISYIPENFNYEFESADEHSKAKIKITAVPFELSVQFPEDVINGSEIEYIINYKNISDREFKLINIKTRLPEEFEYKFSEPEYGEKKDGLLSWSIENVAPRSEGKFVIKGNIIANESREKEIKVMLSASENNMNMIEYINKIATVKVKEIPITIKQLVNGLEEYYVTKGEELEYTIKFKNISDKAINGLVVNSELKGEVDFDSLDIINGSYNKESNKITWSAFNVPKLASFGPGEEEEVSFKIKAKDYIEIEKLKAKNLAINNRTTISSFNFDSNSVNIEKAIASNESSVKFKASLFVRAKGYFNDDGRIKNNGVIPPEAGKETNYLIHWNLSSLFNDTSDVRIISTLPEEVNWTGNYIRSDGKVSLGDQTNGAFTPEEGIEESESAAEDSVNTNMEIDDGLENNQSDEDNSEERENQIKEENFFYNTKTREVVWELPKLDANTGITSPVKEVVFQISVKPKDSDVGKIMKIMNEVKAVGYDEFVNKEIITFESELTTELPDDYSIGIKEGIVIEGLKDEEE